MSAGFHIESWQFVDNHGQGRWDGTWFGGYNEGSPSYHEIPSMWPSIESYFKLGWAVGA